MCEGMYDALSHLMGGTPDRGLVLDSLELVFLLIDEHCDGGIVLEVDGSKLASAVLLRDDDHGDGTHGSHPGVPPGVVTADMTIGQALRQAREQFMANMGS
jgi:hypothetical protein